MARSHALTAGMGGALTVLTLHQGMDLSVLGTLARVTILAAAAGIVPDWDHPSSTMSSAGHDLHPALDKVSDAGCVMIQWCSSVAYAATRTGKDGQAKGTHRYLTHTAACALGMGAVVWLFGQVHPALMVVIMIPLIWVGKDAFASQYSKRLFVVAGAAGQSIGAGQLIAGAVTPGQLVMETAVAVTVGVIVHQLGDLITEQGVPLLWPLSIQGERWHKVRLPRPLRITTGGAGETAVVVALGGVTVIALAGGT